MAPSARQAIRRWGNSLGVRLPATIVREAHLLVDQHVDVMVVEGGILIRPAREHLSLKKRLSQYRPMEAEATELMAWDPIGSEVVV
jgi:antitoxin MazE